MYPEREDPMSVEYSFEELRAKHRGWANIDWAAIRREERRKTEELVEVQVKKESKPISKASTPKEPQNEPAKYQTVPLKGSIDDELVVNDENTPPLQAEAEKAKLAKKSRREERSNRTRKIKVMEVKEIRGETQTSKTQKPVAALIENEQD